MNSPASDFRSAIIHRTYPVHTGLSGEPAEQRLLRMRTSGRRGAEHARVAHRTVYRTCPVHHRTVYRTCPVHHRTARRAHMSELQRSEPNGLVTWLAHRTVSDGAPDSVRWRTGLSGVPVDNSLHQTASLVVGVINTPNHPTFK
jgi:hypothetical protein